MLAAGAGVAIRWRPSKRCSCPRCFAAFVRAPSTTSSSLPAPTPLETDARVVHCPDWALGPGASLRYGLAALPDDVEAAVVVLADGPDLSPAAVDRVVEAWREGAGDIVAASYGGDRGHPVVLGRKVWGRIPDEGARAFDPVLVPCDDLGSPGDVDIADEIPGRLREESAE